MDWTAVGSVGALAAALIAYLQYRHSRKLVPSTTSVKHHEPPTLEYRIYEGSGSYALPEGWKVSIEDPRWMLHQKIEDDLGRVHFALVRLMNKNRHAIERVAVQLSARECWSARVESTNSLAESAVRLSADVSNIEIRIDEMPAGEDILVSVLMRGFPGSTLHSTNAAIKLKSQWD